MTTFFIFGWIWSLIWAYLIIINSSENKDLVSLLNKAAARSDDPRNGHTVTQGGYATDKPKQETFVPDKAPAPL